MALLGPEANNHGAAPIDFLRWQNYPRMFRRNPYQKSPQYGFQTTSSTKPGLVSGFNRALADGQIHLHDHRFFVEAQSFVADGKGGYGATRGQHDDQVMAHLICQRLLEQVHNYPVVWRESDGPVTVGDVFGYWGDEKPRRLVSALDRPLR
jgi:hypothetical protein